MRFGIKVWSTNKELLPLLRKHFELKEFDYVEISALRNSYDEKSLSALKDIPAIVHIDNNQVNFADKGLEKENHEAILEAQRFADYLDAQYIIVHPGYDGSAAQCNAIVAHAKDKRFCLENMPGKTVDLKHVCIGRTYEELKSLSAPHYCLDIAHAIKASVTLQRDPLKMIEEFCALPLTVMHISDGKMATESDEHLNIGEGDFPFKEMLRLISATSARMISLETPKGRQATLENDIRNIQLMRAMWKEYA